MNRRVATGAQRRNRAGAWGSGSIPVHSSFTPRDLSWEGYWRASWLATPWLGTQSGGNSGNNTLVQATNPPGTFAVGSYTAADFDGTNDVLTSAQAINVYAAAAAYSGFALVNVDAITTNDGTNIHLNNSIFADTAGRFGIVFRSNNTVSLFHFNGTSRVAVATAISTGTWQLVQWKYDGTNMKIRVNSGAWASSAQNNAALTGATVRVGQNATTVFYDGKLLEIAQGPTVKTDANFDDIVAYVPRRYPITLA